MRRLLAHTIVIAALLAPGAGTGCDAVAPEEAPGLLREITEVRIGCTELDAAGGETPVVFTGSVRDPDGLGGAPPQSGTMVLRHGRAYRCAVSFLDTRRGGREDLTPLVRDDARRYRVPIDVRFTEAFETTLALIPLDADPDGLPLGLAFRAEAATDFSAGGTLRTRLLHYDSGEKGDPAASPRTLTDVEIPFVIFPPP